MKESRLYKDREDGQVSLNKSQQLMVKERQKTHQQIQLSELKNEQLQYMKERAYWTIGEEVILLKYVKCHDGQQWNWDGLKQKLRKKDGNDCQKRYDEIRRPKDGEYEKAETPIDKSWDERKESILLYCYMKYQGQWGKIQKRISEFSIQELQEKLSEIQNSRALSNQWNVYGDYQLMEGIMRNKKFQELEGQLGKNQEEIINHVKEILEELGKKFRITENDYLSDKSEDSQQIRERIQILSSNNSNNNSEGSGYNSSDN
ncbi:unnamed protein product [Paramecium sonneborni]|uniref:Myb-like domain-containing protein n=1 Tax=Paramecium sonneborni TaxID=65129 RepID=A0A8S1RB48_9CILI|nr:unnamed protein product [Paramecium sonneborni]